MIALSVRHRASRRRRIAPWSRAGFTLVESMVAIVILTVGLLGSAGLMASSVRRQRLTATRGEMAAIADGKIDELRAIGMTALGTSLRTQLATGGSTTSSVANYFDTVQSPDGRSYLRRWEIAVDPTGARRVSIRIEPATAGNYQWRRLDFTTLVAF